MILKVVSLLFLNSQFLISNFSRHRWRLSSQWGISMPNVVFIFVLSSTEYAGRFAFAGYSAVCRGFTLQEVIPARAMNSHCEIIPGTNAFIAEMVDAADYTFIYNGIDGTCQVISISRGSDLVENNSQTVTLFSKTDHCLHKIIAESGIKPCSTDYDCFLAMIHHVLFSFQFGGAVYGVRTRVAIFRIRSMCSTVKDIIGRYLYHGGSVDLCRTCQLFRCFAIQFDRLVLELSSALSTAV